VKRLVLLALVLVGSGCGGGEGGRGTATLWVTRDRGTTVLYQGTVPAGLTAMQALDRELQITTRYGGRFVQSIAGIEGDASRQRDWFWYVNGIEGDRSAAEYRLRPGDVEWWDLRSWKKQMSVPVVVGAFPEPFLHGYDGRRLPASVLGRGSGADALARLLHASRRLKRRANVLRVVAGDTVFHATKRGPTVTFVIDARDAARLAANPKLARFRYEGLG
jgi:hypothetical protein